MPATPLTAFTGSPVGAAIGGSAWKARWIQPAMSTR